MTDSNQNQLPFLFFRQSRFVAKSEMVCQFYIRFGIIEPKFDHIWVWLHLRHRWAVGIHNPLESSVTGFSLLGNCYLEIKFHNTTRVSSPLIYRLFNFTFCTFVITIKKYIIKLEQKTS